MKLREGSIASVFYEVVSQIPYSGALPVEDIYNKPKIAKLEVSPAVASATLAHLVKGGAIGRRAFRDPERPASRYAYYRMEKRRPTPVVNTESAANTEPLLVHAERDENGGLPHLRVRYTKDGSLSFSLGDRALLTVSVE